MESIDACICIYIIYVVFRKGESRVFRIDRACRSSLVFFGVLVFIYRGTRFIFFWYRLSKHQSSICKEDNTTLFHFSTCLCVCFTIFVRAECARKVYSHIPYKAFIGTHCFLSRRTKTKCCFYTFVVQIVL